LAIFTNELELLRAFGAIVAITTILWLLMVEFVLRKRIAHYNYYWLLFIGLFIGPSLVLPSITTTMFLETRTVDSCASCHVMQRFVDDMQDGDSPSLAARHFLHKWIPENQCYACHSTYGFNGSVTAKMDGLRHWAKYVSDTYIEPIQLKDIYSNQNCLYCHQQTPKYDAVSSHQYQADNLLQGRRSCTSCHGPPHETGGPG